MVIITSNARVSPSARYVNIIEKKRTGGSNSHVFRAIVLLSLRKIRYPAISVTTTKIGKDIPGAFCQNSWSKHQATRMEIQTIIEILFTVIAILL